MYLRQLLDAAQITDDSPGETYVVLVPAGILAWADKTMAVSREVWETLYTRYKPEEPDVEAILSVIFEGADKDFMRSFAQVNSVKERYAELLGEDSAASTSVDTVASATAEATVQGSTEMESEEGQSMMQDHQIDSGMKPDMQDAFGVEDQGLNQHLAPNRELPIFEGTSKTEGAVEDEPVKMAPPAEDVGDEPASMDSSFEDEGLTPPDDIEPGMEFGGPASGQPAMVGFEDDLPAGPPAGFTSEETGISSDGEATPPAIPEQQVAPEAAEEQQGGSEDSTTDGEQSQEGEADAEAAEQSSEETEAAGSASAMDENMQRQMECQRYVQTISSDESVTDAADWADACIGQFEAMAGDYMSVFEQATLLDVFAGNATTATDFFEKVCASSYNPNDVLADCCVPETTEEFMALLREACCQALWFCCNGKEDEAVKLADMFGELIYEG